MRIDDVEKYLRADRQWPRLHRIAHAKFMLAKADEAEKGFWTEIIKANEVRGYENLEHQSRNYH